MEKQFSFATLLTNCYSHMAEICYAYAKPTYFMHKPTFMSRIMILVISFRKHLAHTKEVLIM